MNILALDIGTTSMRGILFGPAGEVLETVGESTPLLIDKEKNTIEQRPEVYTDGTLAIVKAIAARRKVDAISVTAFRSAPTLVDRTGNALRNFIMWQDTRNREICQRLRYANADVYRTCGASINTVFTASKLTWLKENEPETYARAYKAMVVPDYVMHFMTGVFATDPTYGSRTLLMDIRTLRWDEGLCALFGVDPEKLCEIRKQSAVHGRVNREFARLTGVAEGTPVVSAGGDQQCGALGLGVLDGGTIEVNSGTGSFVISLADRLYLQNPSVIYNVAVVPGMYIQEMNVIASASALNWLIREFFPEYWGDPPDFAAVDCIAAQTPPGANGLFAMPHFQGCGSRNWNPEARAGFWGLSLSSRRDDLIRALYEGIAAEIAKSIDVLPGPCREAGTIAVAGGLSKSDIYNQILCDMTGRTLVRGRNAQATAVGAFVSAAVALGHYRDYGDALAVVRPGEGGRVFQPDPERTRFYQAYKATTEKLFLAAKP
ncbi:FGGY-family carbohydrate kinase [Bacillota bacterium Meth-B3]|nr:FGGY-family carbohydrate kinase [Christensenellaceae bacterium]MEA5066266.1 FGGY-family carbohydrate kinase [Eubacteriales bacterium]MEA5069400.1 FGGY-family carbohydrate kinase [Christensenellaceae bacterium]